MAAAYDKFDYSSYWEGREYEHQAEVQALKDFLDQIPKIDKILEIGAGFGRLVPFYAHRAKKIVISDPSSGLLKEARANLRRYKPRYVHAGYDMVVEKLKAKSIDLVILVRVLHHIEDPKDCFEAVNRLLDERGYFILEFANKSHFKAEIKEILRGNITYPLDIFTKDIRSEKAKKQSKIPFNNYHPHKIEHLLQETGFEIVDKRSVSNFRNPLLKRAFPINFVLSVEEILQKPLAYLNFGPSIFILARKKTHITDL
jgi:ubiquinone/menaquinone biosynthesis C-methylase UbiE